jgi:transposase InsO family protein
MWLSRKPSKRAISLAAREDMIAKIFAEHKNRLGSPKMRQELRNRSIFMGKNQVAMAMRRLGLRAKTHKRFTVKTTDSKHSLPIAQNLLNRQFDVAQPNKALVSDITYVWTNNGWAYLVVFIDLFSRSVVSWNVSDNLNADMVLIALKRAIKSRSLKQGTMIHSDRGSQYAATVFRETLKKHGLIQSMSRKGNCWDNAVAESFFRIYKTEMAYHCVFLNADDLKHKTFEYIEGYYNRKRLHSTINFLTPAQREKYFYESCA